MRILVLSLFLLIPTIVEAQTQPPPIPTQYTMTTHLESQPNGTPISTYTFQKSAASCDQAVIAVPGTTINPRYIRFTDPERPTRDCVLDTGTSSGVLFAMPFGGKYVAKLLGSVTIDGINFDSPPSAVSNPFVRGASPAVPVGVRIGSSD